MGNEALVDLYSLDLPADLKKLSIAECNSLCEQIRKLLIDTVSKNGGHLASNLGVVELTMAVHRVFDSPKDKIVWDVSHQSYTHKILTGRLNEFSTLRQSGGISGFSRPSESVHDCFVCGHSSTAVSAALGYATAMRLAGDRRHCAIAVVGDGAATGGLFFEGINNAGKSDTNTIVILNHNEMSISKNVGGFAKYLSTLRTTDSYIKTKGAVENVLNKTPIVGKPLANTIRVSKNAIKEAIIHSTFFEDMGFEYIGPIDGHNLAELEFALKQAKAMKRPVIIHVNTVKGKGYAPAEANSGEYHAIGSFEIKTGHPDIEMCDSYSIRFGKKLCALASRNKKICAVTAAMKYGTGLHLFAQKYPSRFFDVGIAEEHAVTFCAGLASAGLIPVFAVYSTFLQRCYDQLVHDVSIAGLHVVLGIDRAGIVAGDGETHQGMFDVPMLTSIPNTSIYSPSCSEELELCVEKAVNEDTGLCAVRYPKGEPFECKGRYEISANYTYAKNSSKILIVTYGRVYNNVLEACETLSEKGIVCDVLKLVKIFPLGEDICKIVKKYKKVYIFEESYKEGSVAERIALVNKNCVPVCIEGFLPHAEVDDLLDRCSLSAEKIAEMIERENQ